MKMILAAMVIMIAAAFSLPAQSGYADSILGSNSRLPDNKQKAENLLALCRYYRTLDFDSAFQYAAKTYDLAFRLGLPEIYAEAVYMQALLHSHQDNYAQALELNNKYLHIADSLDDAKRIAKGYYNRGNLYLGLLEFDSAFGSFNKSLPVYLAMNDTLGILANTNSIGRIYLTQSVYDSALVYFLRSLEICEAAGKPYAQHINAILDNLCSVFLEMGQYDKALEYTRRSLELNLESGVKSEIADDYNELGRIYSEMGLDTASEESYKKALELYRQVRDTVSISHVENNLGVYHKEMEDYKTAIIHFDRALEGYKQKNYTRGTILACGNKAVALAMLGNYGEAIRLNDKVIELANEYDLDESRRDALDNNSWYLMKTGDYKKAYEYLLRWKELNDSIFSLEKTRLINDLTMKYDKQKDQAEILRLENINLEKDLDLKRKTIQSNAYMFTGLAVLLITGFLVLYFRQKARKDRIISQQKIRQLEDEKKFMAARLLVEGQEEERKRIARELHDGLGVILSATKIQFTSIKDKSPENKPVIEKAIHLLEQATGDVRRISHNMMPGLLTKLGLYEAVEDLVENLEDSGKIHAACEIDEKLNRLPENHEIMIYRVIQEMVNNTLKHAEAMNIRIRMWAGEGNLHISYSDDGKGFDVERKTEKESFGLNSIRSRVGFVNGTVTIISSPGKGVQFLVTLPASH